MAEFTGEDLSGSDFRQVDLSRSRFREVDLTGVSMRGVMLRSVDIDGWVEDVRINGVDVMPLVEAELVRRYPERAAFGSPDPVVLRDAWAVNEDSWAATVERARRLPPERLHERVDDEWSFIETLRHLVFATDAWIKGALLGDPSPFDPLGLPHTEMPEHPRIPRDLEAKPDLDEVLVLRADRMAVMRTTLEGLSAEALAGHTAPNPSAGYPEPKDYSVAGCVHCILDEEWAHRMFAERDLSALEAQLT